MLQGDILSHDALTQPVLHIDQLFYFALQHLRHGYPRPLGYDSGNIFFIHFPQDVFTEVFGEEAFVRVNPPWTGGEVEDDLFAGLR